MTTRADGARARQSRTVKVLKMVNQGVVLAAMEHLHHTVLRDSLTKDVRGRDGWRVVLEVEPSRLQLFHVRRWVLAGAGGVVDGALWGWVWE